MLIVGSVPTIWFLDNAFVLELCKSYNSIIVCEEYSINGRLRNGIARLFMEHRIVCKFVSSGILDESIFNGNQLDILANYGINPNSVTKAILAVQYKNY
ncbi:transketolase C-terminal domain-containing protein [Bartonella alsatica]|uniref:Transketolase C-terminal domain-containing protein n=1 Tax=Bartonella alsatica IBS 382 TaxID=1094551 RepID=J0YLH6_9HYPH|nr:transketolase C-terminal domain-containing protein [Bartonella alsatica]EJF75398.1 hypothetical protein MEC_00874 [Bartonella alsatica IBS 382]